MARLLLYIPIDIRSNGGAERYTWRLAVALAKRGNHVCVVTHPCRVDRPIHFSVPPPDRVDSESGVVVRWVALSPLIAWVLSHVWSLYKVRATRPLVRLIYGAVLARALRQIVQSFAPDMMCVTFAGLVYSAEVMAEVARASHIPWGIIPLVHTVSGGYRGRRFRRLYRTADHLFALTRHEATWLETYGGRREHIHIIGASGTQDGRALEEPPLWERYGFGANAPVVLFLGRKVVRKGYRALLDAMPRVWQVFPETRFVFVGQPGERWARDTARSAKDSRFLDLGEADDARCQRALADCSLLCVPSLHESFGMMYTEAWQFEKPVIAADTPVSRELIGACGGGILVAPHGEAIADAILRLLHDPTMAHEMGMRGRAALEQFHQWQHVITRFEAALLSPPH